jgi:predicted aspartyl protease
MRLFLLLVLLCGMPLMADAACTVTPRTSVSFLPDVQVPAVPVTINGVVGRFLLDTGAERSVVTPDAVSRLHLRLDDWVATTMRGVGGIERHRNADPDSMSIGEVSLRRHTLARDRSLTVATLPSSPGPDPVDGLLGRDFLSGFDLQLDMLARTMSLYTVEGCHGRFLPWNDPYVALPVEVLMGSALVMKAELDGVAVRALLDTGASSTLLLAPGIARLGLSGDAAADRTRPRPHQRIGGLGPAIMTVERRQFREFRTGSVSWDAPSLLVGPMHMVPIVDMLLGDDWLADKRLWLSFSTGQVFLAQ